MAKKFLFIFITFFCVFNLKAQESINLFIDVSGSVAGQSANRSYNSFSKIKDELRDFLPFYLSKEGTLDIITFTDSVLSHSHLSKDNIMDVDKIISNILPQKGNSNLINILQSINEENLIVLISDGLNNINTQEINYEDFLNSILDSNKNLYMLRIDNNDDNITIHQFKNHKRLINSLKELDFLNKNVSKNKTENDKIILPDSNFAKKLEITNDNYQPSYNWTWILWIILGILIIIIIVYLIINLSPLIINTSAAAMQSSIYWLYNLPKPMHYFFRSLTSSKMKKFLNEEMVSYKNYKRGKFIPATEQQKEAAEIFKKITGKYPRYKNGEIDFDPVAKFKVPLKKGLDNVIPKGKDVRKNVHKAQEFAADQMINSKEGKKIIAEYNNISPEEVNNYEQYRKWKDDELRRDTPEFDPLTPHETSDGKEILFVPKRLHDVGWGGISHTGGVSMLSRIRDTFGV